MALCGTRELHGIREKRIEYWLELSGEDGQPVAPHQLQSAALEPR